LRVAQRQGLDLRTHAMVVAQVWRNADGRQVGIARLLRAVGVEALDEEIGRATGILLGISHTSDPIDAALVLVSRTGDRIVTSDPHDIRRLASAARRSVNVVEC
jgi:hypothetical protein